MTKDNQDEVDPLEDIIENSDIEDDGSKLQQDLRELINRKKTHVHIRKH